MDLLDEPQLLEIVSSIVDQLHESEIKNIFFVGKPGHSTSISLSKMSKSIFPSAIHSCFINDSNSIICQCLLTYDVVDFTSPLYIISPAVLKTESLNAALVLRRDANIDAGYYLQTLPNPENEVQSSALLKEDIISLPITPCSMNQGDVYFFKRASYFFDAALSMIWKDRIDDHPESLHGIFNEILLSKKNISVIQRDK